MRPYTSSINCKGRTQRSALTKKSSDLTCSSHMSHPSQTRAGTGACPYRKPRTTCGTYSPKNTKAGDTTTGFDEIECLR